MEGRPLISRHLTDSHVGTNSNHTILHNNSPPPGELINILMVCFN